MCPPQDSTFSLADALTQEHREIDASIEEFVAGAKQARHLDEIVPPLNRAMTALRRHIYLEEEFVFPPVQQAGLMMPVLVMLREHGELWRAMDALEEELAGYGDQEPGDEAMQDLIGRCHEMLDLQDRHNSKEEPIIYPHADTDVDAQTHQDLQEFMRSGAMPNGWVCEKAAG